MNIQAYIESGILESYVNGLLSDEEAQAVDRIAEQYPEVHKEIEEIRLAIATYAKTKKNLPQPPPLSNILEKVEEDSQSDPPIVPLTQEKPYPQASPWMKYLVAASVAFLVGLSFFTAFLYQQVGSLTEQLIAFQAEVKDLQQSNTYFQQQYTALRQNPIVIEPHNHIVADPLSKEVVMRGLTTTPDSKITLYWHESSHDVYLVIQDLPEPPHGHQYQLWAVIDGVSVDAGIFDHHGKMQRLKNIVGDVSAFKVTLEEKGGSPSPKIDNTYLEGKVNI